MDLPGLRHDVHDLLAERVNAIEVGPHAFQHDLVIDVDHVGVPHATPVDDIGHLHSRFQLVTLNVDRENADLAGLHVFGNLRRQASQRAFRQVLQHESLERRTDFDQLIGDAGSDVPAGQVGDDRDLFVGLNPQAGLHGVAGPRRKLGVEWSGGQIGQQWWCQATPFLVVPGNWRISQRCAGAASNTPTRVSSTIKSTTFFRSPVSRKTLSWRSAPVPILSISRT